MYHTGERNFKCKHCDKCFINLSTFQRHERIHTRETWNQSTNTCLSHPETLQQSKRTCTTEKPYKCKQCSKCFPCPSKLNRHTKTHTQKKVLKYKHCGKCFSNSRNFLQHEQIHTGAKSGKCQKQNSQQSKRKCTEENPHKCKHCNKGFQSRWKLERHERIHTKEMPFKCKYCGMGFNALGNRNKHEETVHLGGKSSKCKTNGKDSSQLRSERAQRRASSTPELSSDGSQFVKNFTHASSVQEDKSSEHECWICLKEFSSQALLLEHIDSHMESN